MCGEVVRVDRMYLDGAEQNNSGTEIRSPVCSLAYSSKDNILRQLWNWPCLKSPPGNRYLSVPI